MSKSLTQGARVVAQPQQNGHVEYSNDEKRHAHFSVATFPNVVSKHQNPLKLTWGALRERFTTYAFRTNKDGELFAPVTFKPGTRRKKENVGAIHLFSTRLRQRLCTRRLLQRLARVRLNLRRLLDTLIRARLSQVSGRVAVRRAGRCDAMGKDVREARGRSGWRRG